MKTPALWKGWVALFEEEDDPREPHYDPVHLATVLIACLVVIGALYWLLWTLLVYEGGLPSKAGPLLSVLFNGKTLADYGWRPAYGEQGAFEGWLANLVALILCGVIVALLHRADRRRR